MDKLPFAIYTCFVLYNFCELNSEAISEESVASTMNYDREFQSASMANNFITDCNESEGKNIRRILTKYFVQ